MDIVGRAWPERVHVQNMEQLHAHDRCQNVTEHKTSGHNMKQNLQVIICTTQKLASPAGMSCPVCMVAGMHTGLAHNVPCRILI